MKVALVHYWLLGSRGGEKVLEAICRIFPEADIFTLFYDPESVSALIRSKNVKASFLNPFKKYYRSLLPLMPMALEGFDLRAYDLVISSESGPAKGVLTSSTSRHLCYCHTPMRYLWELYPAYRADFHQSMVSRALMAPVANYLRTWDYSTAARVDTFMANSRNVKRRIWRTYRRKAHVVYPPVPVDDFYYSNNSDYFLMVSEMVAYKRLDYVVRSFARNGRKLKIVGDGPEHSRLRKLAAKNVEFCGRVPDHDLRELYANSTALLMPGQEDFGMTMVESLASGKPVIALGSGGAIDIVGNGCGVLYAEPTETCLEDALRSFDRIESLINPQQLISSASKFSEAAFERHFRAVLNGTRPGVSPRSTRSAQVVSFLDGIPGALRSSSGYDGPRGLNLPPAAE
jgi:glycosyltransferase involved in cell wall biosynthesis